MKPELLYATIHDQFRDGTIRNSDEDLMQIMTLAVAVAFEALSPLFEESVESSQNNALVMLGVALVHANEHDQDCKYHSQPARDPRTPLIH